LFGVKVTTFVEVFRLQVPFSVTRVEVQGSGIGKSRNKHFVRLEPEEVTLRLSGVFEAPV
jgi:hypothetical protein